MVLSAHLAPEREDHFDGKQKFQYEKQTQQTMKHS